MKHKTLNLAMAISLIALTIAACGGGGTTAASTTTQAPVVTTGPAPTTAAPTQPAPTTTVPANTTTVAATDAVEIRVSAVDSEGFSTQRIEVFAGQQVTLIFDNQDTSTGEPHNIHVKTDVADFLTPITMGPDVEEMTFTIDTPGEYEFFCDTHTTQMMGTLVVKPR